MVLGFLSNGFPDPSVAYTQVTSSFLAGYLTSRFPPLLEAAANMRMFLEKALRIAAWTTAFSLSRPNDMVMMSTRSSLAAWLIAFKRGLDVAPRIR